MKNVKEFYQVMDKLPKGQPMEELASQMMITFMMNGLDVRATPEDKNKEEFKPFYNGMFEMPMMILNKRSAGHGIAVFFSYGVVATLGVIVQNVPGSLVMYMAYLANWSNDHNIDYIDLKVFADIFPMGTFSEDDLHMMWKLQKDGGANLLDSQSYWEIKA